MKKAVVFLNMGGAKTKKELEEFLYNMFKDTRIISSPARHIIAPLMKRFRSKSVWKNYEKIGGSNIYEYTKSLCSKVQRMLGKDIDVFFAMRYTKPKIFDIFKGKHYDEIIFFALYPHFSTTTTLSSYDEVDIFFKNKKQKIIKIEPFFDDEEFNKLIINSIKKEFQPNMDLIFSAHGLPVSISKKDKYESHINLHVEKLSNMLKNMDLNFKSISLAYQSKIGPIKWLTPAIDEKLREFPKNSNILIYPISFVIDNSETEFELDVEYRHIANKIGYKYKVCRVQNDSEEFAKYLTCKIKNLWN